MVFLSWSPEMRNIEVAADPLSRGREVRNQYLFLWKTCSFSEKIPQTQPEFSCFSTKNVNAALQMIALLQSDDDISQELHLTVMKKSITYSGVHYYFFF